MGISGYTGLILVDEITLRLGHFKHSHSADIELLLTC